MTRKTLTRLVLLAGLSVNGAAAFGQTPKDEPVIWERGGTIRTSATEFTAPQRLVEPPAAAPAAVNAVVPASYSEQRIGPRKAYSVRNVFVPIFAPGRSVAAPRTSPPAPLPIPQSLPPRSPIPQMPPAPRGLPKYQPPGTQPNTARSQSSVIPASAEVPAEVGPHAHAPSPAPAPAAAPPAPAPTWHGHKYPVQPFPPPGAFPIAPTGPGYYTMLERFRGEEAEKPPRWPYPRNGAFQPPFNEMNFSYLDAIPFEDRDWAEKLKRIPLGEHWLFSTGGEARYRYDAETNSRLSGRDNTYDLVRTRAFADLWYEDRVRLYAEFLYGDTINQDLPPLLRDVNRGDIQQLFADVRVCEIDGNPVFFRVGRQELFYGSQRLVSAADWGDNRFRFDGFKLFYRSEKFDADAFVTRPVQVRFDDLDPADRNLSFSGLWLSYKPKKGTILDAYYLNFENDTPGVVRGRTRGGSANISTFGTRFYTKRDSGLLIDAELMLQTGHWADQSILAHAYSAYAGWYFKDCWGTPTLWAGYDYASGDPDPNATGRRQTFNQLYGFSHYYLGFADLVARQNIHDFNVQGYFFPTNWILGGLQYHVFRLDSSKDALYAANGAPIRRSPTGAAGFEVGSEIDVLANFHLTDRQDILVSYSHFFCGAFVQKTGPSNNMNALYAQYSWRW